MPVTAGRPAAGMLRQTITYLEMTDPPGRLREAAPDVRLEPPVRLAVAEYCALQRAVGEPWLWWERLVLGDDELRAITLDPRVEVRLLREEGRVLGFSEIDRRDPACVEIAFLGLVPEAIGRGLGRLLLDATLAAAWAQPARRVCTPATMTIRRRSPSIAAPASASSASRRWRSPTPGSRACFRRPRRRTCPWLSAHRRRDGRAGARAAGRAGRRRRSWRGR